jgi:dTDP-glucose 4,6-dehydratase
MILVTGAAGFIGSNFVLDWLAQSDEPVVNLDALTYAGNLENLASLEGDTRHIFIKGSIGDFDLVAKLLAEYQPRAIVNFAAESHVDRSIHGPEDFIQTNIVGTFHLLEAVRAYWNGLEDEAKASFAFCTSQPTKFTAHSPKKTPPSPKPTATSQTALTQPAKLPATISSAPTTTPTACRY